MLALIEWTPWTPFEAFGALIVLQIAVFAVRHGVSRRFTIKQVADAHGIRFGDRVDPARSPLTFTSLRGLQVQRSGMENVLAGTWGGVEVLAGDLWSRSPGIDGLGVGSRRYRSIAVVPGAGYLPFVRVRHAGVFRQTLDAAGGVRIRFDSIEFNRRFQVVADSTQDAFAVIDQRMMTWLMESAGRFTFETGPAGVLVISRLLMPHRIVSLMNDAVAFAQHVPRSAAGRGPMVDTETELAQMMLSPSRVAAQTNVFGFHSADSVPADELRNAFHNRTWARDPHLRRFVFRQSAILLVPFLVFAAVIALLNGPWLGMVPWVLFGAVAVASLARTILN